MHLRPYRPETDAPFLVRWLSDPRTHALWCGDRLPYPLTPEALHFHLREQAQAWNARPFTAVDAAGTPAGFLCYAPSAEKRQVFLTYVVTDAARRGQGLGARMMALALDMARADASIDRAALNVYDVNVPARRCYEKAGFRQEAFTPDVFSFGGESWGRILMKKALP